MEYLKEIISAGAIIIVALIEAFAAKDRKKASEERKLILERSEIRAKNMLWKGEVHMKDTICARIGMPGSIISASTADEIRAANAKGGRGW